MTATTLGEGSAPSAGTGTAARPPGDGVRALPVGESALLVEVSTIESTR